MPGQHVGNDTAHAGDLLLLTKPLGTGIITTAGKQGVADRAVLEKAIEVMSALNRDASEAMTEVGVSACTDVTGFGLLGHLKSMAEASGVTARVRASAVPLIRWDAGACGQRRSPGRHPSQPELRERSGGVGHVAERRDEARPLRRPDLRRPAHVRTPGKLSELTAALTRRGVIGDRHHRRDCGWRAARNRGTPVDSSYETPLAGRTFPCS